jgi:putative flippase GtrA
MEILRYILIGGFNTFVGLAVFSVLNLVVLPTGPVWAQILLAHLVSVPVSYTLQARYVFRKRGTPRAAVLFLMVSIISLSLNLAGFPLLKTLSNLSDIAIQAIVLIAIAASGYLLNKFFTFAVAQRIQ